MKTIATIFSVFLLFVSCSNGNITPRTLQKIDNSIENFDTFFEKFFYDSAFQCSRIKFPLAVETYDIDLNGFKKSTINAGEWNFFNIKQLNTEYVFIASKEKDQTTVTIQKEDTGLSVDYTFQQQQNKWILIKIVDQST